MVEIPRQAIATELGYLEGFNAGVTVNEVTVTVWHEHLNHALKDYRLSPTELHECVRDVACKATYLPKWERLTPQVLVEAVVRRRRQRIVNAKPPTNLPGDETRPAWLVAWRKALGDGATPEQAEAYAWAQVGKPPPRIEPATRRDIEKIINQIKKGKH